MTSAYIKRIWKKWIRSSILLCIMLVLLTIGCSSSLSSSKSHDSETEATASNSVTRTTEMPAVTVDPTVTVGLLEHSQIPILPLASSETWSYQWIKGKPCRAPCWEGIVPGETTLVEAFTILDQNRLIGDINPDNASWNWSHGEPGGSLELLLHDSPATISRILPMFPNTFSLSDIINSYGNPGHIGLFSGTEPHSGERYYLMTILYLSQGFELVIDSDAITDLHLSADSAVGVTSFFVPSMTLRDHAVRVLNLQNEDLENYVSQHVEWAGFRSFEFYCEQLSNHEAGLCN